MPARVEPLEVSTKEHQEIVSAGQLAGMAQVLELGVPQVPLLHVYEQLPIVYPAEHVPLVPPLAVRLLTQFDTVLAGQPAGKAHVFELGVPQVPLLQV